LGVIAIACDSESKPIPVETPLTAVAPTSDCPGCLTRERVPSAQPGDTIEIAAGGGAGLSNWGEASLVTTTIDGNRSKIGGGFHNNSIGIMTLDSSTVSNNESALAGGINNWGRLRVINSTISHNTA
jgi:hypothetical protein|tara:strand:+ start:63 stop:443 length:381 start_codon:yes stop_codon:yes gene_type:complete